MFREWLREECNLKLRDYKKLSDDEKLDLYTSWLESVKKTPNCPCCGAPMLCGYPAWDGRSSYYDLNMALVAKPARSGIFRRKEVKVITPMAHICQNCGFVGLFASSNERKTFVNVCCDIDYHD